MRFDRMKSLTTNQERTPSPKISDRRISKPLIEKKRRARINASLCELKTLLEVVLGEEVPRDSKMEKADVLELAVRHLRDVNRVKLNVAAAADPTVLDKYRVGFSECANEIGRYLSQVDGVDIELRSRLVGHLSNCMTGLKHDQDCRPRPFMSVIPNPAVIQQQQLRAQQTYQNMLPAHVIPQQPMKISPSLNIEMTGLPQPIANEHRAMHLNTMQNGPLPAVPHGQQHVPGGVLLVAKPAHEVQLSPIFVNTHSPKEALYTDNLVKPILQAHRQVSRNISPIKYISPVKMESGLLKIDDLSLKQKSLSMSPSPLSDATRVRDNKVWRPW